MTKKIQSAKSWIGKRVEARQDSGWGTLSGYTGIVQEDTGRSMEEGWFSFIPDDGKYPEGILAHTQEFFAPNAEQVVSVDAEKARHR